MARKKASGPAKVSWAESFWDFVEANPKLAAAAAFQIGVLAAEAMSTPAARALRNRVGKGVKQHMPQPLVDAMPDSLDGLAAMALKYLPGPSPKLQPRKRLVGKARRARKAKTATAV